MLKPQQGCCYLEQSQLVINYVSPRPELCQQSEILKQYPIPVAYARHHDLEVLVSFSLKTDL